MPPRLAAALGAIAVLVLSQAPAAAQQSFVLDGRPFMLPAGVEAVLGAAPAGPGSDAPPADAVEFRWPDGVAVTLSLHREVEPFAELPPRSALGAFDADGIAPVSEAWALGAARGAGPSYAEAADGLRSYVVRTGNPAYPLARILCVGRGTGAGCRLYSRVGESSVLSGPLPSTDPKAVATGVSRLASLLFEP